MLKEIANILRSLPQDQHPLIGFIGDTARTWFIDHYMLMDVMAILRDAHPGVVIINGGQMPFDGLVERMALRLNMDVITHGYQIERVQRLASMYDRPSEMLRGLEALIVFHNIRSADKGLGTAVVSALELGIPVVSVDREGRSSSWEDTLTKKKRSK